MIGPQGRGDAAEGYVVGRGLELYDVLAASWVEVGGSFEVLPSEGNFTDGRAPTDDGQKVGDGTGGLVFAGVAGETPELSRRVGATDCRGWPGALTGRPAQPLVTGSGLLGTALAVSPRSAGPAGEARDCGEVPHPQSYLGDGNLGGALVEAGCGSEPAADLRARSQGRTESGGGEMADLYVERVPDAARQGLWQSGDLLEHDLFRASGRDVEVALIGDQHLEHEPSRDAHGLGGGYVGPALGSQRAFRGRWSSGVTDWIVRPRYQLRPCSSRMISGRTELARRRLSPTRPASPSASGGLDLRPETSFA